MKYYLLSLIVLSTFSSELMAKSCFPLYQAEAEKIDKDNYEHDEAMKELQLLGNTNSTQPYMSANNENWAKNLFEAIQEGPDSIPQFSSDKSDWLSAFQNSIEKNCNLPNDNYSTLREMLTELMEDGSFCPGNEIIKPKFFKYYAPFKEILAKAVKDQRFVEKCRNKAVSDDSFREVKEHQPSSSPVQESSSISTQKQ